MLADIYGHTDSYNSYNDDSSSEPTQPCRGGPKKCGNNKGNFEFGIGHLIISEDKYEVWVQPEADGTLTVHHVYLARQ